MTATKFEYPDAKFEDFVKPADFPGKKLSGRILNAFTNIPYQIYKEDADDEWVSIVCPFSSCHCVCVRAKLMMETLSIHLC